MNNKILSLIFFGLLALLIARKTILKPTTKSFRESLSNFDSATIDKLTIQIGDAPTTTLTKSGEQWQMTDGTRTMDAKPSTVTSLITELSTLKTKQLVSKSADKWADYEVDDKAKKIEVYSGGKRVTALHIGRFNFNQQTRAGISYARLSDEDEIYSLDGFLAMSAAKDFDSFRETKLVTTAQEQIQSINLTTESGQQLELGKSIDGSWIINDTVIDSTAASRYISGLTNLNGSVFEDGFSPSGVPATINAGALQIQAYSTGSDFVIKSNQNPAYFRSDSSGIYKRMITDLLSLSQ